MLILELSAVFVNFRGGRLLGTDDLPWLISIIVAVLVYLSHRSCWSRSLLLSLGNINIKQLPFQSVSLCSVAHIDTRAHSDNMNCNNDTWKQSTCRRCQVVTKASGGGIFDFLVSLAATPECPTEKTKLWLPWNSCPDMESDQSQY